MFDQVSAAEEKTYYVRNSLFNVGEMKILHAFGILKLCFFESNFVRVMML